MKHQSSLSRSFNLLGCSVLLILFGWLTAAHAVAGPVAAGPLPLPDMLIYGTVTNATGDRLESGTLKALLNGQTIASAQIGAIGGTDYTYVLAVPISMLAPGSTERDSMRALVGDVLSFTVDDRPAYYQDPFTSLTVSQLRIPSGAAGGSVVLDLALSDALRYLIGDVNANGTRNAADAMLTLKYDIGLITGVTSFPPGPNTVYLPLCDIVENGRCDSSDALRILQCDVGLSTVTCPVETIAAVQSAADLPAQTADAPTHAAGGDSIELQVTVTEADDAASVDVSVLLIAGADRFGAASFELQYDPALLTSATCAANPDEVFDMVLCNLDYAPGIVRFNAVATSGVADSAMLTTLRFQYADDATDQAPRFTLTADSVTDVDGAGMGWRTGTADTPEAGIQHWLFLPAIGSPGQTSTEPSPQEVPHRLFLPAVGGAKQPSLQQSPQNAPHWLFLPAVGSQLDPSRETSETGEQPTQTPSPTAISAPVATPMPEPTATPTEAPSPTPEPTVAPTDAPSPTATPVLEATPVPEEAVTPVMGPTAQPIVPPVRDVMPPEEPEPAPLPAPQAEASRRVAVSVAALLSPSQQRSRLGAALQS